MTSTTNNKAPQIKISLICGILGPTLFILMFVVQAFFRFDYSSLRHPVSSLSIGDMGWIQVLNFIVTGTLVFCFGLGLQKLNGFLKNKWGSRLISMGGLGFIGAGIFTTDPIYGYPPDLPLRLAQFTITGHLHDLCSLFVFIALPIAVFKYGKLFKQNGNRKWANYSYCTGFTIIVAFLLAGIGFKQVHPLNEVAGILQRISIIAGCLWVGLLAFHLLKNKRIQIFK